MSIEVEQFQLSGDNPSSNQNIQKAYMSLELKYTKTLTEFNSFKESSIISYQKMLQQMEKNKTHNQKLIKKLQKKYQNLLHQERTKALKNTQKLKTEFEKQRLNFRQIINSKNQSIQKLSQLLHKAEQQKSQIIQENTQNLINIVKSQQNCLQSKKYSHTELMKMYQFLLQQNNCLKKQLMKVKNPQEKSIQKSTKNKNRTQILYSQQSDKIESMYVSSQNQSQLGKKKLKSKQNSLSVNINASTIKETSVIKASSSYKQKNDQVEKNNKINLSVNVNDSSVRQNQNGNKRKQTKKPANLSKNQKKQDK